MNVLETNDSDSKFIKRKKIQLSKKYKPTNSDSIWLANYNPLSVFLLALNSKAEFETLLDMYSENSPYIERYPQRWEAVIQAITLNAYIKSKSGNVEKAETLKNLAQKHPLEHVSSIPTGKKFFYRLYESLNSNIAQVCKFTQLDKCIVHAEHYLIFVYGVVMLPELCAQYEIEQGVIIEEELEKLLAELRHDLKTVK